MKIIHALFISEMCVCDLSTVTGSSQSAVSHQLKILRQNQLVKFRKEGKILMEIKLDGLNCALCAGVIEDEIIKLIGVVEPDVSYKSPGDISENNSKNSFISYMTALKKGFLSVKYSHKQVIYPLIEH